jgi:hypothetical protein
VHDPARVVFGAQSFAGIGEIDSGGFKDSRRAAQVPRCGTGRN